MTWNTRDGFVSSFQTFVVVVPSVPTIRILASSMIATRMHYEISFSNGDEKAEEERNIYNIYIKIRVANLEHE